MLSPKTHLSPQRSIIIQITIKAFATLRSPRGSNLLFASCHVPGIRHTLLLIKVYFALTKIFCSKTDKLGGRAKKKRSEIEGGSMK